MNRARLGLCCCCDICGEPICDDTETENNGLCDACLTTELELALQEHEEHGR
jgi:hypothetical protein